MATGYLFGNKFDSSLGQTGGQYFIIGRVKKIVLGPFISNTNNPDEDYTGPSDIGKIRYEILYSTLSTSKTDAVSEPAYPIFSFIKQYPVLNEIVLIMVGPTEKLNDRYSRQQFFYFPPYSIWNNPNHGAFPNMGEYADFLNNYANKPEYSGDSTESPKFPLGFTFQEKNEIRNLQPFEGDIILQSRFGQSIRFGSTVPVLKNKNTWSNSGDNGSPITIITNQQANRPGLYKFDSTVEDINRDGSSIYMTSTQQVDMPSLLGFPLNSFGVTINPIVSNTTEAVKIPTSNFGTSAAEQDSNTLGNA